MTEDFSIAEDFSFSAEMDFILSASGENKPPTRISLSELEGEFSVGNSSAGLNGNFSSINFLPELDGEISTEKSLVAFDSNPEMRSNSLADMESGSPIGRDEGLSTTGGVYEDELEKNVSSRFSFR